MRAAILLVAVAAFAQPQQDPVTTATQAYWKAQNEGRFGDAAAARDEARAALKRLPADAPAFSGWTQQVSQLFEMGGQTQDACAIVEDSLARVARLEDSHYTRIALLNRLSDIWRQDRNLLKALASLEEAARVADAAPPLPAASTVPGAVPSSVAAVRAANGAFTTMLPRVMPATGAMTFTAVRGAYAWMSPAGANQQVYQRLAAMYQELGRPDAAASTRARYESMIRNEPLALAAFYESQDEFERAAAIYRKLAADNAADPQAALQSMQALSNLYMRQERYDDAAAILSEAIGRLETSTRSNASQQAMWMRQNLANVLRQAGRIEDADKVYEQLLSNTPGRDAGRSMLMPYASYLASTGRGAQAEALLKEHLASHPEMSDGETVGVYYNLSAAARSAGDQKRAEEYQKAANEKQRTLVDRQTGVAAFRIGDGLQTAHSLVQEGKTADAFNAAMAALDRFAAANDRDTVAWSVPGVANAIGRKDPARAELLYARLFEVLQGRPLSNSQSLAEVAQQYAHFLMAKEDTRERTPAAIQRYRDTIVAARGPETGWLADAFQLTIDLERSRQRPEAAVLAVEDMLRFEEAHNGATSEPYSRALEIAASVYDANNDEARATDVRRRRIAIGDLLYPERDPRRAQTRMNVAFSLAHRHQFDEAERLGAEALALSQSTPRQLEQMTRQMEEIRRMRRAAPPL